MLCGCNDLRISSHNFDYYSNRIDGGNKHTAALADTGKQIPGSANSSDYDKSGKISASESVTQRLQITMQKYYREPKLECGLGKR